MSGVKTGALARSLTAITVGHVRASNSKRDTRAHLELGEIDHQFQVPFRGRVDFEPWTVRVNLTFDAPFVDGYDERQPPFSDPTFTYGVVQKSGPAILANAVVRQWIVEGGVYTGAVLEVTLQRPWGPRTSVTTLAFTNNGPVEQPVAPVPVSGEFHLNFQGYGVPNADTTNDGGEA